MIILIALGILVAVGGLLFMYKYQHTIISILILIVVLADLMSIPIGIIRSTIFKDTMCIQILYSDGHEDYKFVQSSDYHDWIFNHKELRTKYSGTLTRSEVTATTPIYNVFTGNTK